MSDHTDSGPAFPRPISSDGVNCPDYGDPGMSLRDWFAGQALTGLLASVAGSPPSARQTQNAIWAREAYRLADAMLKERSDG